MSGKMDKLHARFRAALADELKLTEMATWMQQHRAKMSAMLVDGKMDWAAAAETFARAGLRDADGRRPTAGSAQAAWRKVRRGRR